MAAAQMRQSRIAASTQEARAGKTRAEMGIRATKSGKWKLEAGNWKLESAPTQDTTLSLGKEKGRKG
jgi:hypothetical protein